MHNQALPLNHSRYHHISIPIVTWKALIMWHSRVSRVTFSSCKLFFFIRKKNGTEYGIRSWAFYLDSGEGSEIIPQCVRWSNRSTHRILKFIVSKFKGSSDPSHFIFETNVGKRRIRHRTTMNLNDVFFKQVFVDLEKRRSRNTVNFRVVVCRIRLFPTLILKWLGSILPLK